MPLHIQYNLHLDNLSYKTLAVQSLILLLCYNNVLSLDLPVLILAVSSDAHFVEIDQISFLLLK